MNQQLPKQDFDQSSPSCAGLDYIDLPAQTDLRYGQEPNTSPLNLESSTQSTAVIGLYPSGQSSVFSQTATYQPDTGASFYPSASSSHIFSNLDVRPRLGATTNNSTSGMAHAHRAQLPHPAAQITARDLYSPATPSFRRTAEHPARSPSFPGSLRHHPLSPTPSPSQTYTTPFKMDSGSFGGSKSQTPPLQETTTFGTVQCTDGPNAGQTVKLDINGTIDKGFFLADKEWTCYRRNYFSCICSFSLSPHVPTPGMVYLQSNGTRNTINGFAMCISAVVADNDNHVIELVQHTPKRDKGPTARPEKVRLMAKPPQAAHHTLGLYGTDPGMSVGGRYDNGYGPHQTGFPSEHTFERIQFKQATANNGKRRAAQQYYHLLVEVWANVTMPGGGEQYVKVAHRKSAKMIVRGRSPGHYQSDRRGSTSSGPGGSAGSLGYGGSQVLGSDFGSSGSAILPGGYGGSYDPRSSSHYGGGSRHHQQHQPQHQSQHQHQHQHQPHQHQHQHPHQPHQAHQPHQPMHQQTHQQPHQPPHQQQHQQHAQHPQHLQHDMNIDHPIMATDDVKAIAEPKEYQYFPAPICDSSQDPRQPVEMFSHAHHRSEQDTASLPHMNTSGIDLLSRVKHEGHHEGLPAPYYPGSGFYPNRCGRYEGKSSSSSYYPSLVAPTSGISMS